jgi:hypothetical protein
MSPHRAARMFAVCLLLCAGFSAETAFAIFGTHGGTR